MDGDSARPAIIRIEHLSCLRNCGWFREFTNEQWWLNMIVTHPQYGPVTGQQLVQLDMQNHDCIEAANARVRARKKVRVSV